MAYRENHKVCRPSPYTRQTKLHVNKKDLVLSENVDYFQIHVYQRTMNDDGHPPLIIGPRLPNIFLYSITMYLQSCNSCGFNLVLSTKRNMYLSKKTKRQIQYTSSKDVGSIVSN